MPEHIKMPDIVPVVRYVADGDDTNFSFPFPIFASEDLKVYLNGATQVSGFTVSGAGQTNGGSVTFDSAPGAGTIVTLERDLPLERLTDFLEGGDFSAQAINTELDFLIAALQQVDRGNNLMLKYSDHEAPAATILPQKALRANKALGFDGDGNPIAVSLEGAMAAPSFTANGTGAVTRTSVDKFSDIVSIKDFGAAGDGLTDDALAIQNALAAHDSVLVPDGVYLISNTINLASGKSLIGLGNASVLKAQNNNFDAIQISASFTSLRSMKIVGGATAVKLVGGPGECVQNNICDLYISGPDTGILLDGGNDLSKPCYWNNFARILIEQPLTHGIYLTKSGLGDTPNANRFHMVRVFSKGAATTGSGFYVEHGALNNAFMDCEANVNGPTADSCFRLGAQSNKTLIMNLLTESTNAVPNIKLDSGSQETVIINLTAQSDGAAILDNSGGNYDALNAGSPDKNTLRKTTVSDLKATLMRYDTEFIDSAGTTALDLSHSVHLVNATNGAITVELPAAASAAGAEITVKKVDNTGNIVTVTESQGDGPDGKALQLGGPNDYATIISNGAQWYIKASNRLAGNTRYIDSAGTVDVDMAVDTYLVSSFGGTLTMRLPPADAVEAVGRTLAIKKTDSSSNVVNVTEQGGAGPDQSSQSLSSQYQGITVVSNGAQWYILSRYP